MKNISKMDNQQPSSLKGKGSTTSHNDVESSDSKRGASFILVNDEDIVWTLNENLKKFSKKYNYLYKTTCLINNYYYIGRHSTNNLKDNYLGSGKVLKNYIKKYGKSNFSKEILYYCKSFKDLVLLEESVVNEKMIKDLKCLNLVSGGLNPILIGKNNPNYGKPLSKEQKDNLSKIASKKVGAKNPFYKKKHSDQTKDTLSLAASKRKGSLNHFYGKQHTEKTKEIISNKLKQTYKSNPCLIDNLSNLKKMRMYYTPFGVFDTALKAAKESKCSKATILNRCVQKMNEITGVNYQTSDEYKSLDKTWKDFGWFFTKLGND